MNVTTLYADLAKSKALWAQFPLGHPLSERFAQEGLAAAERLAATPATNPAEALMKLAEFQEIASPDLLPAQSALLTSCVEDAHRLMQPAPAAKPSAPPPPPGKPRVHRTARPVTIDGTLYPSITAAAKATGIAYEALRTGRIG